MEKTKTTPLTNDDSNNNKNKRNDMDRLSSLPDSILVHILSLSHLPTTSIVATSLLSKRWRNLWTQLTHLRFSFHPTTWEHLWSIPNPDKHNLFDRYLTSIDRVLNHLLSLDNIRVFDLSLVSVWKYDWTRCNSLVNSWVRRVCSFNLEEINIQFRCYSDRTPVVLLPSCVFECQSLVSLHLDDGFDFDFDYVALPKLKKLGITILDGHKKLMATLFKSCPLLEDLLIKALLDEDEHLVDISSPNLRCLSVTLLLNAAHTKILINAPKLEQLKIFDHGYSLFQAVEKFTRLYEVDIQMGCAPSTESISHTTQLVKDVSGTVRSLKLEGKMFMYVNLLEADEIDDSVTIFDNLTELEYSGWRNFFIMLYSCPNLETLQWSTSYKDRIYVRDGDLEETEVPLCLSRNVKRIRMLCFEQLDHELLILEYILRYGKVLEHLTIDVGYYCEAKAGNEVEFCQRLFCCPRLSKHCEVEFCGKYLTASTKGFKNGILDCQIKFSSGASEMGF